MRFMRVLPPVILLAAVAANAVAQMMPPPPQEMARFAPILGAWEGEGTASYVPGQDPTPWTARLSYRKILDGFFIREDLEVDLGMPQKMYVLNIYGWDAAARRYVMFGVSNGGAAPAGASVHWVAKNTIMITHTTVEDGRVLVNRSLTTIEKDSMSFETLQSADGGEFRVVLKGQFKRAKQTIDVTAADAKPFTAPPASLKKLEFQFGNWDLKGSVIPVPGMAKMPVSGTQEIRPIMAGHAHMTVVQGAEEPGTPTYRGIVFLVWLENEKRFLSFSISNFGEMESARGYALDDTHYVYFSETPGMDGKPILNRSTVTFDASKNRFEIAVDRLAGTAAAERSFWAACERKK